MSYRIVKTRATNTAVFVNAEDDDALDAVRADGCFINEVIDELKNPQLFTYGECPKDGCKLTESEKRPTG